MKKKVIGWLSEVNCTSCKSLVYLQVGGQAIPESQWDAIKCCENQKKEITYTPIEE